MAKKSLLGRELKRKKLVSKYLTKRLEMKKIIKSQKSSLDDKLSAQLILQKMPLNSSPSRVQRRCVITGRAHGVYRKFGLCRNKLREYAMLGDIPGLRKSSW